MVVQANLFFIFFKKPNHSLFRQSFVHCNDLNEKLRSTGNWLGRKSMGLPTLIVSTYFWYLLNGINASKIMIIIITMEWFCCLHVQLLRITYYLLKQCKYHLNSDKCESVQCFSARANNWFQQNYRFAYNFQPSIEWWTRCIQYVSASENWCCRIYREFCRLKKKNNKIQIKPPVLVRISYLLRSESNVANMILI